MAQLRPRSSRPLQVTLAVTDSPERNPGWAELWKRILTAPTDELAGPGDAGDER